MSKAVNYFLKAQVSADASMNEVVQIATRYVPAQIAALEGWKGRSFWISDAHFADAYSAICAQQAELLMGAKEELIREIRGTRGGLAGVVTDDLTTYPVGTFPGYQIKDIHNDLTDGGYSIAQQMTDARTKLQSIIDALAAQGEDITGMLDELAQVVVLLGV